MPKGIYDRQKSQRAANNGQVVSTYAATSPGRSQEKIVWDNAELVRLADEWILLRVELPLESANVLFISAQHKAFADDAVRKRLGTQLANCPTVRKKITERWKKFHEQSGPPLQALDEPKMSGEAQIINIEVPRKLTTEEMLATLDEPTLEALLCAARLKRQNQFHELLYGIAAQAGAANLQKVAPFVPRFEVFESARKAHPRIAIVGVPAERHELVQAEVKLAGLDALLRFPDGKDKDAVNRCDYAIVCRNHAHNGNSAAEGDRAVGQLGRDRVVLMDGHEIPVIVQKIRNLLSRQ